MVARKTLRFWGRYAQSDPARLPIYLARRGREALRRAPRGESVVRFGEVLLPLDMSIHALQAKYFFRTHEMFLERVFRQHLRSGQVFIDIGANCGYWSAFAASRVGPSGQVHMFEPVDRYYRELERFRDANPTHTLVPNRNAVGALPGRADMDVVTDDPSNFRNYSVNTGSNSLLDGFLDGAQTLTTKQQVQVITLDRYVESAGIDPALVGLVKIDVEGFESFVLDGMPGLLARVPRIPLLVEVVTAPERNPVLDGSRVVGRLNRLGYMCLDATTLRPVDPGHMGIEENLICVQEDNPSRLGLAFE